MNVISQAQILSETKVFSSKILTIILYVLLILSMFSADKALISFNIEVNKVYSIFFRLRLEPLPSSPPPEKPVPRPPTDRKHLVGSKYIL